MFVLFVFCVCVGFVILYVFVALCCLLCCPMCVLKNQRWFFGFGLLELVCSAFVSLYVFVAMVELILLCCSMSVLIKKCGCYVF